MTALDPDLKNTGTSSGPFENSVPERVPACVLCGSRNTAFFCERNNPGFARRDYFRCSACLLIFLLPAQRLTVEEEKKHYDTHRNDPSDKRYLEFLGRLAIPLNERLNAGSSGLDFGCGPGPAMSVLFREKGHSAEDYDSLYFPRPELLDRTYDFVTCSETAEHFHAPRAEFQLLDSLLNPSGFLGVMTGILEEESAFKTWWYALDPTHICFYQPQTFEWIAKWRGWELEFPCPNVVLFKKAPRLLSSNSSDT